jgi:hypothetical protein
MLRLTERIKLVDGVMFKKLIDSASSRRTWSTARPGTSRFGQLLFVALPSVITNPFNHNCIIGMTYAYKHKLTFLPHAGRYALLRLPRSTLGIVPRDRIVESSPSEKTLQQSLDRRCWLLARWDVHSHVQRDITMGRSVERSTRKTGTLRSAGLQSIRQYDSKPLRERKSLLSFCHHRDKCQ